MNDTTGIGSSSVRDRTAHAVAFTGAAASYWLSVYPRIRREIRHWRARAGEITDPALRRLALDTQRQEQGNLEGAAAFAVLAPLSQRKRVVRAIVAFQAIYDYVDTLSEQPSATPIENGKQLHQALLHALERGSGHVDYYAHSHLRNDNGYLRELVEACRATFSALPGYTSLAPPALIAARRMVTYQSLNHDNHHSNGHSTDLDPQLDHDRNGVNAPPLARWADAQMPAGSGLRWWETAASAASSLLIFALIALAAQRRIRDGDIARIEAAYFPWIGALQMLLDSLVDIEGDVQTGQRSLVDHYSSPEDLASRLGTISSAAMRSTETLPKARQHELIFAAMASLYLSQPQTSSGDLADARAEILATLGERAVPPMYVFRMRRGRRARRRGSL